MPYEQHVRIVATAQALPAAAPETAAVRLISLLPAPWTATLTGVTPTAATLTLSAPEAPAAGTAEEAVDRALSRPELCGWIRTEP
ncbi:hypothetical protein ACFV4F_06460 [Kitasatospora sp. NPDC059722]|uniref:hypothetical protein n=1 Tax=unclassified Kitasatospora TaxID=2633591 RepID=UPI0036645790